MIFTDAQSESNKEAALSKPESGGDLASAESGGGGPAGILGVSAASSGGKKASLSGNVWLLVVVATVAGVLLYGMRKIGLGVGLDFRLPTIDYPIENVKVVKARDSEHERVMSDLQSSEVIAQVPLDDLQRNPFLLEDDVEVVPDSFDPAADAARRAAEAAQRRQQEIERTLDALRLNSIVTGNVPLARINGQAVRIGDTIGGVFTVRAIHGRSVELEADGQIYTKVLGE